MMHFQQRYIQSGEVNQLMLSFRKQNLLLLSLLLSFFADPMSSSHVWDVPSSNLCAWWSSSPLEQSGQLEGSTKARDPGRMTCLVQMTDLGRMADLAES